MAYKPAGDVKIAFAVFAEKPSGRHTQESDACYILQSGLENGAKLRGIFEKYGKEFTVFPVGSWLEYAADMASVPVLRSVYGSLPVGNHTYSHRPLKPVAGREPMPLDKIDCDIRKADECITHVFGVETPGFAAPCGHPGGFAGKDSRDREIRAALGRQGFRWCVSDTRGDADALYAPLHDKTGRPRQPFQYGNGLWEIPAHGWQDVAFKHVHGSEKPAGAPMDDNAIAKSYERICMEARGIAAHVTHRPFHLVSLLHPDFMRGPAAASGGYCDESLGIWDRILNETLELGVDIVNIEDICDAAEKM